MDGKIDNMIAKSIQPAEMIIQGKSEVRKWSAYFFTKYAIECFLNIRPVERFQMDIAVFNNIGCVVKNKLPLKAVRVNDNQKRKKGNKSKDVFSAAGETPPDIQIKSIVFVYHFHLYII